MDTIKLNENPSDIWTATERLMLISLLASELALKPFTEISPGVRQDANERIMFLAKMNRQFLEDNRNAILNGQG